VLSLTPGCQHSLVEPARMSGTNSTNQTGQRWDLIHGSAILAPRRGSTFHGVDDGPTVYRPTYDRRTGADREGLGSRGPTECVNGHQLGPDRVLVGHQPCTCLGSHMAWTGRTCDATFYWPPANPECSVLTGARPRTRSADLLEPFPACTSRERPKARRTCSMIALACVVDAAVLVIGLNASRGEPNTLSFRLSR
jgi:hypothetical protein